MENNKLLNDEDIPQVAMDVMNDVHREELNIVNHVNAAIEAKDSGKITLLCQEWLEHTKSHFAKENTMMEKYSFPAYHCHFGEHVEALQLLESIITSWNDNGDLENLSEYVREVWPKWYVNHISTMDTVTSIFIKQSIQNE
jgi:hemerythrin